MPRWTLPNWKLELAGYMESLECPQCHSKGKAIQTEIGGELYCNICHFIYSDILIKSNLFRLKRQAEKEEKGEDDEANICKEIDTITSSLNEKNIQVFSQNEKVFFQFIRDMTFDIEFALLLKKQFSPLWNRLLKKALSD